MAKSRHTRIYEWEHVPVIFSYQLNCCFRTQRTATIPILILICPIIYLYHLYIQYKTKYYLNRNTFKLLWFRRQCADNLTKHKVKAVTTYKMQAYQSLINYSAFPSDIFLQVCKASPHSFRRYCVDKNVRLRAMLTLTLILTRSASKRYSNPASPLTVGILNTFWIKYRLTSF